MAWTGHLFDLKNYFKLALFKRDNHDRNSTATPEQKEGWKDTLNKMILMKTVFGIHVSQTQMVASLLSKYRILRKFCSCCGQGSLPVNKHQYLFLLQVQEILFFPLPELACILVTWVGATTHGMSKGQEAILEGPLRKRNQNAAENSVVVQ